MAISAILGAGKAILGGIGQAKAIKAENARRIREYERAIEMRKRNWYQQLSVYSAKVNKYNIDLNENDLAAQRGYAKAQSSLRALGGRVTAENEASFRKLVSKKLGRARASGQTGRGVARGERLDIGEYLRGTGRRAYGVSMAREKFKENVENIRRRQVSARRGLFSQVAFNPVPSMAPNPPELRGTGMVMANAMMGAFGSLAKGGMFDKGPGAPTGGGIYDFQPGDVNMSSFTTDLGDFNSNIFGDFGGAGTFTPFDMNVNAVPDFSWGTTMDSSIFDTPLYGF